MDKELGSVQLETTAMKIYLTLAKYLILLFLANYAVGASSESDIETRSSVSTKSKDISFSVNFSKIYPDAMEVTVNHTVINTSDHAIKCVGGNRVYDRRISLYGPDGKQVAPYPYDMSMMKRFTTYTIEAGGRDDEEISLASYFPFNTMGEYRCTITKRVYDYSSTSNKISEAGVRGDPLDLTAPGFSFRIESLKHVERTIGTVNMRPDKVLDGIDNKSYQTRPSTSSFDEEGTKSSPVRSAAGNSFSAVQSEMPAISASPWWWTLLVFPLLVIAWLGSGRKNQK